jgi:hypothetical protein
MKRLSGLPLRKVILWAVVASAILGVILAILSEIFGWGIRS